MKQTKIVASISDQRCDVDFIRNLFDAGMNVVRMNTAHATPEGIRKIIRNTRAVSRHIGILIDTKGPEIRTTANDAPIEYKTGDVVKIFGRPEMKSEHDILNLSYENFSNDVHVGDDILFDDGAIDMKVIGIKTYSLPLMKILILLLIRLYAVRKMSRLFSKYWTSRVATSRLFQRSRIRKVSITLMR